MLQLFPALDQELELLLCCLGILLAIGYHLVNQALFFTDLPFELAANLGHLSVHLFVEQGVQALTHFTLDRRNYFVDYLLTQLLA
ncbi:Uncharacterised protein [Pseudomonas fragi]|uniref:Uncharacterized protein n=1 Tax=Pseudomonas fragi TaxID=296 RepID=A0A449IRE4_PSEFR|nr:Uncharacterised protein [Pseudomonas fragi]